MFLHSGHEKIVHSSYYNYLFGRSLKKKLLNFDGSVVKNINIYIVIISLVVEHLVW